MNKIYNLDYNHIKSLQNSSVDLIYADFTISRNVNTSLLFRECIRILKNEGTFIIVSTGKTSGELMMIGHNHWRYNMSVDLSGSILPEHNTIDVLVFGKELYENSNNDIFLNDLHKRLEEGKPIQRSNLSVTYSYQANDKIFTLNQLPQSLYKTIISSYSNDNDIVLDIFMDKGSFLSEAVLLNRNYIGYEADPFNYKFANNQIRKAEIKSRRLSSTLYYPMYATC